MMPYKVKKVAGGYKVVTETTGKAHSKKALPKQKAVAQMRALYANTKEPGLKRKR